MDRQTQHWTNPRCLVHRTMMKNAGRDWWCEGHWTTRKRATSLGRRPDREFARSSASSTGRIRRYRLQRSEYPWCINCKRRMQYRGGRGRHLYICGGCPNSVTQFYVRKSIQAEVESQIAELIQRGFTNHRIRLLLNCGWATAQKVRNELTPAKPSRQMPWKTERTIVAGPIGKGGKRIKGEIKVKNLRTAFECSGLTKGQLAERLGWNKPNIDRVNRALGYRCDTGTNKRSRPRQTMTYELALVIANAIGASYSEVGL